MKRKPSTRRRRNGVEVHVDVGSHNARGSRGAKTNPRKRRAAPRRAARARARAPSAAEFRKLYGPRALSVAFAMKASASTAKQRAHFARLVELLERERNPVRHGYTITANGAELATFKTKRHAMDYGRAFARAHRSVRVQLRMP